MINATSRHKQKNHATGAHCSAQRKTDTHTQEKNDEFNLNFTRCFSSTRRCARNFRHWLVWSYISVTRISHQDTLQGLVACGTLSEVSRITPLSIGLQMQRHCARCCFMWDVVILIKHERHQQNSKKHTKAAVYSKSLFITTNASSKDSVPTIHQKHSEQHHRQSLSMVASVKETLGRASKQHLSLVRKVVAMLLTDKHHLIALTVNQHRVKNSPKIRKLLPKSKSNSAHFGSICGTQTQE